ncbi:serine hydrolase [Bradyrhizobium sp. SYSU BS000235]|uniref:serine hydrolase n=1 Tax=Bradyrhizobium sp. SYSU BS000235 TaxID=3411332 RepID=UPI003C77D9E2
MLGVKSSASSRTLRLCLLGVATISVAVMATTNTADARRRHRHHRAAVSSYSPAFSSIIVDANSGATLQASSADGLRHPASLTKIMTLYMLFERLESGKIRLDTPMDVSEHASEQAPTKLGLRPGQTIRVEDAIKGLVTRSANDAAVVIAEALGGSEDEFAKMMTRKARALGMSKTVYVNASGLPDDAQITTARDQSTLGRAIQDRFPKYYRYFSTAAFTYRGKVIRNHNHLLGRVEGVDGIKTGYTRSSGFNLVTSMKRGNRFLVGVVMGGRSAGSRDAIMRNLLAEHVDEGATRRTVAAITERGSSETRIADARSNDAENDDDDVNTRTQARPAPIAQAQGGMQLAAATSDPVPLPTPRAPIPSAQPVAAPQVEAQNEKPAPAPLTSGVISPQSFGAIPGSAEPMTPVRVKTVQVRMGQTKVASAAPNAPVPAPVATNPAPMPAKPDIAKPDMAEAARAALLRAAAAKTDARMDAKAESKTEVRSEPGRSEPWAVASAQSRTEFPAPLPAPPTTNNGIGQVVIGAPVHPSHSAAPADPARGAPPTTLAAQAAALQTGTIQPQQQQPLQQQTSLQPAQQPARVAQPSPAPAKPVVRSGWIIQVGALDSESEARQRLDTARGASKLLTDADPFTEAVSKGSKTFYRARFAGLSQNSAEAACRSLKRSEISCIAIRN